MARGTAFDLDVVKTVKEKTVKAEGSETLAVWEPPAGKRFRLSGFTLFSSVETLFTLEDETAVIFMGAVAAKTAATVVLPQGGYLSVKAANKLNLKTKAEGAVTGTVWGTEE